MSNTLTRTIKKLLTGIPIHIDVPVFDSLAIVYSVSQSQQRFVSPVKRSLSMISEIRVVRENAARNAQAALWSRNAVSRRSSTHGPVGIIRV